MSEYPYAFLNNIEPFEANTGNFRGFHDFIDEIIKILIMIIPVTCK